jgi:subtilisin family serine protease
MIQSTVRRPLTRLVAAATGAAAVVAVPLALMIPTQVAAAALPSGRYIVMTAGDPLATYAGGVPGFKATRPKAGAKVDTRSANARGYAKHLSEGHTKALAAVGASGLGRHDYSVAFNGFSATLTGAQADAIAKAPGVVKVWKDEVRKADTISTPGFLGLSGATGVWQKQFGGVSHAGEGVIIADLDTGIWAENPAFAPLSTPRPDQATINAKWHGVCDAGAEQPIACTNKIIGARYYGADYGNTVIPEEFVGPRDYNGHGSHTASTAAGANGVTAVINGGVVGQASGMAPAARLAVYKVLWETADHTSGSGTTAGIVAGIDDAVSDGVDVINYSISGSSQYIVSPDELAFFSAAQAGVFISASAGNSGDTVGASSVAHNAPWEMTVAASTHDRGNTNTVTLGNGAVYHGVGVSLGIGPKPLIRSVDAVLAGADPEAARLCYSTATPGGNALDPAKVAGKIVICDRGVNARVDKSQAVKEAGGVGMVLANTSAAQSLNADFHIIPTSHVNAADGTAIKAYAASVGSAATATISARDTTPVRAPEMAGFSSFGPALAGGGDLLKPDITAPGVDVVAAVAPPGNNGNSFDAYSGTSMAAPHITGLAALVLQAHPGWSPMWVKSALMTTASPLDNKGLPIQRSGADATPLDYGNGHVTPAKAFDPGLVYDNGAVDWVRYGCGIGQFQLVSDPSFCATYGSIDPSNLNYPSIAVAGLAGSQTVTRTVTNTSVDQASQYTPTVVAPAGFTATVNVDKLTVPPLQSRSFSVTFTRTTAPLTRWAFGSLTWTDKRGHSVRSAVALQPVAATVPTEVSSTGTSGSTTVSVTPGFTGTLAATAAGLNPATVGTVTAAKGAAGTTTFTAPAGTKVLRFATYDADYPANTDVDLVVKKGAVQVGSSGGATAEEAVNLSGDDLGGTYTIQATYFAGATGSLGIQVNSFAVGTTSAGNLTVTPASQAVTVGRPASATVAWTSLTAGTRYLGSVDWSDGTNAVGRTLVAIVK